MKISTFQTKSRFYLAAGVSAAFILFHLLVVLLVNDFNTRLTISDFITPAVSLWAAVAMFLAARQPSAGRRISRFWRFVGFAQLALAIGEILWSFYEVVLGRDPFATLSDVAYLLYYPLFLLAIFQLPREAHNRAEMIRIGLDMLIVGIASLIVFWNFLLGPLIVTNSQEAPLIQFLALAYPVGDLMLIWALVQLAYRLPEKSQRIPLLLLAAGSILTVTLDCLFSYQSLQNSYSSGSFIDIGYTAAYLLWGLAGLWQAWVPAENDAGQRAAPEPGDMPTCVFYLPFFWAFAAYMLLVIQPWLSLPMSTYQLILLVGVIILLVIIRQILVIRENRLLSIKIACQWEELEETNYDLQLEIGIRRKAEEKLSYAALHDNLTGLPNRAYINERLEQAARLKRIRPGYQYSVLFLDLDDFKVINDSMGHTSGDQVLVRAAQILTSCVRATDTVARLGGDEFVILLEDIQDADESLQIAARILEELEHPIDVYGSQMLVTASLGIVLNVGENDRPDDVLGDADLAMYHAKNDGKDRFTVFLPEMRAQSRQRLALQNDIRYALENRQFCLHYQPVFNLANQRVIGFEALLRWQHPKGDLLLPADFLSIAENLGLSARIIGQALELACLQRAAWQQSFPELGSAFVSLNLSAGQLRDPGLLNTLRGALQSSRLPADLLAVEINESVWCDERDLLNTLLPGFDALGIHCQVDNFGSDRLPLVTLNQFPIQTVKIDAGLLQQVASSAIVQPGLIKAFSATLHESNILCIVKKIETPEQHMTATELGFSFGQGYQLARPLNVQQLEGWLSGYRQPLPPG